MDMTGEVGDGRKGGPLSLFSMATMDKGMNETCHTVVGLRQPPQTSYIDLDINTAGKESRPISW